MRLRKQVDCLEERIEDVQHENIKRCREAVKCSQHADRSVEKLKDSIQKLQGQVRCGITGHDFKLAGITGHNFKLTKGISPIYSTGKVALKVVGYRGRSECRNCGLSYTRKLTTQEVNAAKKLGLIEDK